MKRTYLEAKRLYLEGKIDEAWEVAQQDDGLKYIARDEWIDWMARKTGVKIKEGTVTTDNYKYTVVFPAKTLTGQSEAMVASMFPEMRVGATFRHFRLTAIVLHNEVGQEIVIKRQD